MPSAPTAGKTLMLATLAALAAVAQPAAVRAADVEVNPPGLTQEIKERISEYGRAWTTARTGQPDWPAIERFYASEKGLHHYDAVTPHSFANVAEMRAAFPPVASLRLAPRDDVKVFRSGGTVWSTNTQDVEATGRDGRTLRLVQRQTAIWERRDGRWTMLHEHLSSPSSLTGGGQ